eukprot:359347-Chlamydomonas_euryale.AAC.7
MPQPVLRVQPQRKSLGEPQPCMWCSVLPGGSVGQHDIAISTRVPTGWAWRRAGWAGLVQLACCGTQHRHQAQKLHCRLQAHDEEPNSPLCSTRCLMVRPGDDAEVQPSSCRCAALQVGQSSTDVGFETVVCCSFKVIHHTLKTMTKAG